MTAAAYALLASCPWCALSCPPPLPSSGSFLLKKWCVKNEWEKAKKSNEMGVAPTWAAFLAPPPKDPHRIREKEVER
jgi:hypothetical protein